MGFFDQLESIAKEVNNAANSSQTPQNNNSVADYFPPELEKLISITLVDGHITDQEKNVLRKKAISLGVDVDELEIVLNARMAQTGHVPTSQAPQKTTSSSASAKCAMCGAPIDPLKLKCPDCGNEYRSVATQNLLDMLQEVVVEYENECKNRKASAKGLMGMLIAEMADDETKLWERKKQIIQSFKIPATKIDTLEFLSEAVLHVKKEKVVLSGLFSKKRSKYEYEDNLEDYDNEFDFLSPIWKMKCEQVILKAKIMAKNDPEFLNQILEIVQPIGIK